MERRADSMAPRANDPSNDNNDKLVVPMAQPPPDKPVLVQYTLPGPVNGSFGPYGAYKADNRIINYDFEYPPYTSKKIIVVQGFMDTVTTETEVYVEIMGWPIGDFKGNLDDGMRIDVNLAAAKGYLEITDVQGPVRDSIYLEVDLHLPFRQHLDKRWLLFTVPHHDRPAKQPQATA
ncbi:MAG: hypothetical protein Q9225_001970 [Loekoesia sp. 1 TL-2023]